MSLSSLLLALLLSQSPKAAPRLAQRREAHRRLTSRRLRVERLEDRMVPSTFTVTNTADSGAGSLRQAILDANAAATGTAANPDLIQFTIPATDPNHFYYSNDGVAGQVSLANVATTTASDDSTIANIDPDWAHSWWSIQPASSLPTITDPLLIDGYSQSGASPNSHAMIDPNPGDNAVLRIELNGSQLIGAGLTLAGNHAAAKGLVLNRFSYFGIAVPSDANTVQGDIIGTDVSGTVDLENGAGGVVIQTHADNNLIGGTTPDARNLISGNGFSNPTSVDGGVIILNSTGNVVQGNFIGTDSTGTKVLGNSEDGVEIVNRGTNNTIGGTTAAERNLISGNGLTGLGNTGGGVLIGNASAGNLVEGNFIGTDVTGTVSLANSYGVHLAFGASNNTIGGASNLSGGELAGAGNLLSGQTIQLNGNGGIAVLIEPGADSNLVQGNFIGTDVTGTAAVPNGSGVDVGGNYAVVGGAGGLGNLISGNTNIGIVSGANIVGLVVQGNLIGTDVTGSGALGNHLGLQVGGSGDIIGGTTAGLGNVISGNGNSGGLLIGGTGHLIQGNLIGTDRYGTGALGNAAYGVDVSGSNITVGGTASGASNTIAFNSRDGVLVDSGTGNSIRGNSIHDNAGLGIRLNSANSANNNQAFPVLSSAATSSSGTTVTGALTSTANTTFALDFYSNSAADPSGYGQGQTYLGSAMVMTDSSGNATFTASGLLPVPAGQSFVTATATNLATGDTSQFGQDLKLATTTTVASSPNPSFPGEPVTFTATVAGGAGTPTGSVDFFDTTTSTDLGSVPLAGGVASLTSAALGLGVNTIQASYSGDSRFLPSLASLTQTVQHFIFVLNPTMGGALSLSGNASINIPGDVIVDSSSSTALSESGNASVTAAAIDVVGGVQETGNATASPTPTTGAASAPDPLAALAAPTGGTAQGSVNLSGNHALTINPGVYSSINVSGYASLTMNPGVYVIAGGGFTVTGSGSVGGTGVVICNAGSNFPSGGGNFGGITLSGNGSISLSAATSGPFSGVLLFQARDNPRAVALSGNAASGMGGTLYAPAALLTVGGNAQLSAALVVNRLQLTGNAGSTLVADGSGAGTNAGVGELLAGNLALYVNDPTGYLSADELARIDDAVATWDALLAPSSVTITEVGSADQANLVLDTGTTGPCGGLADGVLGCYSGSGEITLIQGWNFYAGADPAGIGASQYDFEALVFHELGHALGLSGSTDATSVMNETLPTGVVRRTPTVADLNVGDVEGIPDAEHAAVEAPAGPDVHPPAPAGAGGATVLAAAPANGAEAVGPGHPVDVVPSAVASLAEEAVSGGAKGSSEAGAPAAGAAAVRLPTTVAWVNGNVQSPTVAGAAGAALPAAGGGGNGAAADTVPVPDERSCRDAGMPTGADRVPVHEPPAVVPKQPTAPAETGGALSPVAFDLFFGSRPQGAGAVIGTGEVYAPATGGPAIAALLGAAWGACPAEDESRKQQHQQREQ